MQARQRDTDAHEQALDVLFISEKALWPIDQGFKVHGSAMASALAQQGLRIGLASVEPMPAEGKAPVGVTMTDWPTGDTRDLSLLRRSFAGPAEWLRHRLMQYLCPSARQVAGIIPLVRQHKPHVVVGLGQHAPIYLAALRPMGIATAWYAADDLVLFHASCLSRERFSQYPKRLKQLGVHLALERLLLPRVGGAIGVSPRDTTWLRQVGGARQAVCIRNGVHHGQFAPMLGKESSGEPRIVFWGRLDFEPNVEALTWFVRKAWPRIHHDCPQARFEIAGRQPVQAVKNLRQVAGVNLVGPVESITEFAAGASAVVLPMRSGAGIKNKLLEAAAMGLPILASPQAVTGLEWIPGCEPFELARSAEDWQAGTKRLLHDAALRMRLGSNARRWVCQYHDWDKAAHRLRAWLRKLAGHPLGQQDRLDKVDQQKAAIPTRLAA